jgi:oxygen-independent coproporphyrinogen-3 oxidase
MSATHSSAHTSARSGTHFGTRRPPAGGATEAARPRDDAALAAAHGRPVPRYTSYPTAPQFTADVTEARYRAWLAGLRCDQALSLYVHVPFCDTMCWFCGCYTKIVRQYPPVAAYLDTLGREIDLLSRAVPEGPVVRHLHWGGGSPTILAPADFAAMIAHLRRRFAFAPDAEIAVELDPRDTTEAYIEALAAAGVGRVSIGVQDFDATVQRAVNRIQPFETVERVCGWLRRHGIERINLDLMYGLPHQTAALVRAMAERALGLRPARVALFGYAHVPWMKSHQRLIDEAALPDAAERLRQFRAASDVLAAAGLRPIGLDHFAHAQDALAQAAACGRLRRNFQGYTADDAPVLLGLGASAIGGLPDGYVQNAAPLERYRSAVDAGVLPIARGIALSADDRLRRAVIEALMCELAVDLDEVCARHDAPVQALEPALAALKPLHADGLLAIDGARITIAPHGRPFVRLAAAAFDAYLGAGQGRHSNAV